MVRMTKKRISYYAKRTQKGGTLAFGRKENANRFGRAMKKKGYTVSGYRSSGPVIDKAKPRKGNKAYVISVGQKRKKGRL